MGADAPLTVDLMFLAHNRREFTRASLHNLCENTDFSLIDKLWILDDQSRDGTFEYLQAASYLMQFDTTQVKFVSAAFGGPVAALNYVLDHSECQVLAKVDNDLIVPEGWLPTMLDVLFSDYQLDALGLEPGFARPLQPDYVKRDYKPARWIGGQGLFRTHVFNKRRPVQHERFFGMTQFQRERMNAAWIDPDLAAFNLDHLPLEPWRSLAAEYVQKGWSRAWSAYPTGWRDYWEWWTAKQGAQVSPAVSA